MVCLKLKPESALCFLMALLVCVPGCASPEKDSAERVEADIACDEVSKTQVAIITEMRFARIDDAGVTWGANLDESTLGCGVDDYVDPEGGTGIDNSFGTLIPILELTEAAAIEVYIQDLINRGEVLIMLEMEDIDDLQDDSCVNVNLLRGLGEPTVGTDRIIESGQTFDRNMNLPQSRTEAQELQGGTLLASPLQVELPFNIFDIALDFTLHSSTLRFNQGVDGHHQGYIAGGLYINEIIDFVSGRDDIDIGDLVIDLVESRADLWPDDTGQCQGISVVFEFEAKPAFFYADP
jgi:hypothetical protein